MEPPSQTRNELPNEILLHIFCWLPRSVDVARASQTCRAWWFAGRDHRLWLQWCHYDWIPVPLSSHERENWKEKGKDVFMRWLPTTGSSVPTEALNNTLAAYRHWFTDFRGFHAEYTGLKRVIHRMFRWLQQFSPLTRASFLPGKWWPMWLEEAGRADFGALVAEFLERAELPLDNGFLLQADQAPLRHLVLFYHFFDGQKPRMPHVDVGFFGSYTCHNQYTSIIMLPCRYLKVGHAFGVKFIIFAVCPRSGKYLCLVLDCDADMRKKLLYQVLELDDALGFYFAKGRFLDFLSGYVDDLWADRYDLCEEASISIFPNSGPTTSRTTTRGIEVKASAISNLEMATMEGWWTYRIALRYVGGPDAPVECQLMTRHWIIRYHSGKVDHVRGEAVVGQFPIMSLDKPQFSYCSICRGRRVNNDMEDQGDGFDSVWDWPVSMEGEFEFITGTIEHPFGDRFQVLIDRFFLSRPSGRLS